MAGISKTSSVSWTEGVYRVETASRRVEREVAGLPHSVRGRVIQAVRNLHEDPRPRGARKMRGEVRGAWRIRVRHYRVIYDVDDDQRLVAILAVLPRRVVYRRG